MEITTMENVLYHHGIAGMKWGVRRYQNADGSLTAAGKKRYYNPDYTNEQRLKDRTIYGRGGERRINKSMNKGHSVSTARSIEARRIQSTRRAATVAGITGHTVGTIGGAIGGYFAAPAVSKLVSNFVGTLPNYVSPAVLSGAAKIDGEAALVVSAAVSTGAAKAGGILGRIGGQSITMLAGGYSPSKYRYA